MTLPRRHTGLRARSQPSVSEARTAYELTENIPVGTYALLDAPRKPTRFLFMSQRWLEMLDLSRGEVLANPDTAFRRIHPDDYPDFMRRNSPDAPVDRPFYWEGRVMVRGETRWVSAESVPRHLPEGGIIWEGALIDITARKQTEEKLRASEAQLLKILNGAPVAMSLTSLEDDGRVLFLNEAFVKLFGYRMEDIPTVDRWSAQAFPDPVACRDIFARWDAAVARARAEQGRVESIECAVTCKNGTAKQIIFSALILDGMLLTIQEDVTERRSAEAELAASREREIESAERQRLELHDKLKTSLTAAAVAHEINDPLSVILMNIRLAERQLETGGLDAGSLREFISQTATEARRVVTTIEKMRSLLRNVSTPHHAVNLSNLIRNALMYSTSNARGNAIRVETRGLQRACKVPGDEGQLKVALINLVRNAMEAIEQKGGENRVIRVELIPGGDRVEIVVGDSGPGLPETGPGNLPFATTKPGGSGIGLYLVRTTMENHHGELLTGRSPLGGAEFRMVLPV